jgi:hypothetical protein
MKFVYSDEEKDDFLKVENLYYVEKEAQSEWGRASDCSHLINDWTGVCA